MDARSTSTKGHTYILLNQEAPHGESSQDESKTNSELCDDDNQSSTNLKIDRGQDGPVVIDKDMSFRSDEAIYISQDGAKQRKSRFSDLTLKISSALLYGVCSFIITVINKIVLTTYKFPSPNIVGLGQVVAILCILSVASRFNYVNIRNVSVKNRKVQILATFYLCNLISSLSATKALPLPMLISLRRFSIAMTAIGEFYLLRVKQSLSVIMTIIAMIGGSFVAAAADLTFDARGYSLVMINNIFSAANGVYTKKTIDSHEINKQEILYYNALFAIIPLIVICIFTNNIKSLVEFPHWSEFGFIVSFLAACVMGYVLMLSTVMCTQYNSALTTTIVGTLKNILTTYVGMYIGGDYVYSRWNFIGLNISLVGSMAYTYITFVSKHRKPLKPSKRLEPIDTRADADRVVPNASVQV